MAKIFNFAYYNVFFSKVIGWYENTKFKIPIHSELSVLFSTTNIAQSVRIFLKKDIQNNERGFKI